MKLHHTKYTENYKNFILKRLDSDGDLKEDASREDRIIYLTNRINAEYGWGIQKYGEREAISRWLQGIAIDIPIWYDEIVDLAIEMGSIDENPSKAVEQKVIDDYFLFMANIIIKLRKELTSQLAHMRYLPS